MEEINYSQSCTSNSEAENYDYPVEFLKEVRVPCLICGADTEINNIVKQEIDQFDEVTANNQEYLLGVDGSSVNHEIFHWFLKWFSVDIAKNGRQRLIDRGWDGEEGEILRFCGSCKMKLKEILELQKQLDELREKVQNGLVEVKGKMERFEETFQSNGAYDMDQRYKLVRSWILKNETENLGYRTQINQQSSLRKPYDQSTKRRSSRLKAISPVTLSNIQASVKKSHTKLTMKMTEKEIIPQNPAEVVRKIVRKKINSRIQGKPSNKVVEKNERSRSSRVQLPRIKRKPTVDRSDNGTIVATDNVAISTDRVSTSKKPVLDSTSLPKTLT